MQSDVPIAAPFPSPVLLSYHDVFGRVAKAWLELKVMLITVAVTSSRVRIQSCALLREHNARSYDGSAEKIVSDAESGGLKLFSIGSQQTPCALRYNLRC
jgi:hypothetical protein